MLDQVLERAVVHHVAAVRAGTGPKLDDVVCLADGGFVVLDHQHRVAAPLKAAERGNEAFVVPGMQADGRLIEHVGYAHQPGTELRGEADALRFPARERGHGAAQRDVVEAHIGHERQPVIQFFEERLGDEGVAPVELPPVQPAESAFHGQGAELVDVEIVHAHGQRFGPQARAVACGAIHALEVTGQQITPHVAVLHTSFKQGDDARPVVRGQLVRAIVGFDRSGCVVVVLRRLKGHGAAEAVPAQAALGLL